MAKNENRSNVALKCTKCKSKNKKNTTEKLILNKFCKDCREKTEHKEAK